MKIMIALAFASLLGSSAMAMEFPQGKFAGSATCRMRGSTEIFNGKVDLVIEGSRFIFTYQGPEGSMAFDLTFVSEDGAFYSIESRGAKAGDAYCGSRSCNYKVTLDGFPGGGSMQFHEDGGLSVLGYSEIHGDPIVCEETYRRM